MELIDGNFINTKNHLIINSASKRDCNPKIPVNVIKSLNKQFFSQEPNLQKIEVLHNLTLMTDFAYNYNGSSIDLLEENEGLLTDKEWSTFDNSLKYGNIKEALGETFNMAQCLDSSQCSNYITGMFPPAEYDMNNLRLPVIESPNQLFPWYSDFQSKIKLYSAEICILALLIHLFLFLFSIFDFLCSQNDANGIRRFLLAIVTMAKFFWKCFFPNNESNNVPHPGQTPTVNIQLQPLIGNNDRSLVLH